MPHRTIDKLPGWLSVTLGTQREQQEQQALVWMRMDLLIMQGRYRLLAAGSIIQQEPLGQQVRGSI